MSPLRWGLPEGGAVSPLRPGLPEGSILPLPLDQESQERSTWPQLCWWQAPASSSLTSRSGLEPMCSMAMGLLGALLPAEDDNTCPARTPGEAAGRGFGEP